MPQNKDTTIYFAPLQESTDSVYRKAYAATFGGIDKYFAPYIVRQNDGSIKKSHLREINPANNKSYKLVPQIMAGTAAEFIFLAEILSDEGYQEINWNLGCPYPMVTNKGLGAGLLPDPDKIRSILNEALPKMTCRVSVKLRSGLVSPEEIFSVIPILNEFPLEEIILHPRIAKQLYRGTADKENFIRVKEMCRLPLVYNGDINTADDFTYLKSLLRTTDKWMIGRGILKDPFLPARIKNIFQSGPKEQKSLLRIFYDAVFEEYSKILSGNSHLLMRMLKFWSYFCYSFPDPHKTLKRIKKSGTMEKYNVALRENFQSLSYEED